MLPTISKVFERVLYTQIYDHFNINSLLCEEQYGFRSKHSTELATIKLVDKIIKDMDDIKNIKTPVAVFLDLSKAFDTLDFDILLYKLNYYGIRGTSLTLIQNYLSKRVQYTHYENQDSDLLDIKIGIPQGSILGPLFFSIYINDLVNASKKLSCLMYADDTTIYFNQEVFPKINRSTSINMELEKLSIWLKLNKLTLNVEKNKYMIFRKRRKIDYLSLKINNNEIANVNQFCFLGIIIDENLTMQNHVEMVTNKLSKITGILNKLKFIYPQNIILTIYNSLFVSHINYGSLVWGTNINRISKMQKRVIRIITHSNYIAHTEPLFKKLKLLKVEDMFPLKILKFLHKLAHNELPPYFKVYDPHLSKIVTPYNLRAHPLPVPPITHIYAESCLVYQLVKMKNSITINDKLILQKIEEKSHSHSGFSIYVINNMLDKYTYDCIKPFCYTCGRT